MARPTQRAAKALYEGRRQLEASPALKAFIYKWCLNEVAHERHFSMRAAMEAARGMRWSNTEDDPYRINNTLGSAFARILIEDHPEVHDYIELRHSICDETEDDENDNAEDAEDE